MNYLSQGADADITKVCVAGQRVTFTAMIRYQLTEKFGFTKDKEMLKDIVHSPYDSALEKQEPQGYIVLEHGLSTVPLSGINVPFHSRYLQSGVMPFCACE
jgi:hypothetical protein